MSDPLEAVVGRTVTRDEADAYLAHPVSEAEREEVFALIAWFRRRYPTPADRLAYVRRAYARWSGRRHAREEATDYRPRSSTSR